MSRRALLFGGTGTVGREVLKGLAVAGIPTTFTFHTQKDRARVLASEYGATAIGLDLADPAAIRGAIASLDPKPDVLIHCAAVSRALPLSGVSDADWDATQAINVRSAFVAAQALAPSMSEAKRGDIVLAGALDRTQSVPIPVHFAATQGALSAMTMALAKELGPHGIRVNLVAIGVLEDGLSRELPAKARDDFRTFSALKRTGRPAEAAEAILWLALSNGYMSGKVLPVNGGV